MRLPINRRGVLLALTVLLSLPAALHAGYEEGYDYAQKGLYRQAQAEFRKAAEKGDARAQYSLGIMYYDGIGVAKDRKEAVQWLKKAADQGHLMAIEVLKRTH